MYMTLEVYNIPYSPKDVNISEGFPVAILETVEPCYIEWYASKVYRHIV